MRVKNAVVVIIGASSGIGRATALEFARNGAQLVLAARRENAVNEVARECEGVGAQVLALAIDVTDAHQVNNLARLAAEHFGRIDAWVNAAAVSVFAPFEEIPLDDFRRVLEVNVLGSVHGARAALRYLREHQSGVLVNVVSMVGVVPQPYTSPYGMSKFAIRALSASLRQELWLSKERRIKVCSVLPAAVDTPFFDHAANYTGRRVLAMPPVYSPEKVAKAIVNTVRVPRREVFVGSAARAFLLQSKLFPGLTEKMMASQVNHFHLSKKIPADPTHGNLHEPSHRSASIHGGWKNSQHAGLKKVASAAFLLAGIGWTISRQKK